MKPWFAFIFVPPQRDKVECIPRGVLRCGPWTAPKLRMPWREIRLSFGAFPEYSLSFAEQNSANTQGAPFLQVADLSAGKHQDVP
eukprot:gene9582-biopygen2845